MFADKSSREWNILATTKLVRRLSIARDIMCTSFKVKPSKVKVTRPTNAHTVNVQYLLNENTYEVQAWYTDGEGIVLTRISNERRNLKGHGRKVT